ncbi:MAG: hypothetical protein QOK24_1474 [Verrucomicrobiota bacterium]|jgi:hypothetical protein
MDVHSFYFDQYKALREEIMFTMGQLYSTEMYGAIAITGIYLWLFVNSSHISIRSIWLIPPFLIVACAIHCLVLSLRLSMIGGYLKELEEVLVEGNKIMGWEHYKLSRGWVDMTDYVLATVAWVFALGVSVAISWRGARTRPPGAVRNASP